MILVKYYFIRTIVNEVASGPFLQNKNPKPFTFDILQNPDESIISMCNYIPDDAFQNKTFTNNHVIKLNNIKYK